MKNALKKFNPAVGKIWLQLAAGLMWSGVGIMLMAFASRWLKLSGGWTMILLILAGSLLGGAIYYFGFSKLARKNIHRINSLPKPRHCLFAFQEWKTYPLVAFMVALGIYLRVYSTLPKSLLAILYIGIGVGLFASSIHYYHQVGRMARPLPEEEQP